jgi:hypothetical protein
VKPPAEAFRQVGTEALTAVPAVVVATARDDAVAGARRPVDLLVGILADVGDDHAAAEEVEGEAPGIAQPVGPDLVTTGPADERVVGGDGVSRFLPRPRVDAEDLAEQHFSVLSVVGRVASRTAVAERDVEVTVRAELKLAAVVVGVDRVFDAEDRLANRRASRRPGAKGVDVDIAFDATGGGLSRVGHVEAARAVEVRCRRDREQAALDFAAAHQRADVGKLRDRPRGDFVDHAFAFGDQQPFRVARVGGDGDRLFEFPDRLQRHRSRCRAPKSTSKRTESCDPNETTHTTSRLRVGR